MHSRLLLLITCPVILFACSGNASSSNAIGSATKNNQSQTQTASSNEALAGKNGMFSYTLNGQAVVCKNFVQHATLFINEVSSDAATGIKIKVTCQSSTVFDFRINEPDKKLKSGSYMDGKTYEMYYADNVALAITSNNGGRITGTFSGSFKADGGEIVNITNGSFDLPFVKN